MTRQTVMRTSYATRLTTPTDRGISNYFICHVGNCIGTILTSGVMTKCRSAAKAIAMNPPHHRPQLVGIIYYTYIPRIYDIIPRHFVYSLDMILGHMFDSIYPPPPMPSLKCWRHFFLGHHRRLVAGTVRVLTAWTNLSASLICA